VISPGELFSEMREFRLPPQSIWELRSSGSLHSE